MKTQQLSNAVRAFILVIAIVILTIVSAKADMIKATYSPYNCTMLPLPKEKEHKASHFKTIIISSLNDLGSNRRFNFKNHPEEKKLKEEVRRIDVTSSKTRLLLEMKLDDCEHSAYKII